MNISKEELGYAHHIGVYERMGVLKDSNKYSNYWHFQAQDMHALSVIDALGELQFKISVLAQRLGPGDAYHQLVFGASRRLKMVHLALRHLYGLVPPNRQEALLHDDVTDASRSLNDIYIHTRGTLDNYAWALITIFGGDPGKALRPADVSLFAAKVGKLPGMAPFRPILAEYSGWANELKKLRDPVAHRIPLSVPPAVLDDRDREKYVEVNTLHNEASNRFYRLMGDRAPQDQIDAASAEVDALYGRLQRIGTFVPVIVHNPNEGSVMIYPTVPNDVGQLVSTVRDLNEAIAQQL